MGITTSANANQTEVVISVRGRFDFNEVNAFRKSYEDYPKSAQFTIDLRQTEHIDSSALGMLLNMRSFLGGDSAKIQISNCAPGIKKILEISRFDKKFSIS